jgi:hypothetical protein
MEKQPVFKILLICLLAGITMSMASAVTYIDKCQVLNVSGDYELNQSVSGWSWTNGNNYYCFLVNASNVHLNCAGYNVTANRTNNIGLEAYKNGFNISNCNFYDFDIGINMYGNATNNTVYGDDNTWACAILGWGTQFWEYNKFYDCSANVLGDGVFRHATIERLNYPSKSFFGMVIGGGANITNVTIDGASYGIEMYYTPSNGYVTDVNVTNSKNADMWVESYGLYNEKFTNVIGSNGKEIKVYSNEYDGATISDLDLGTILVESTTNLTFDNITLSGDKGGLWLYDDNLNLTFKNSLLNGTHFGIQTKKLFNSTIENNVIQNIWGYGIFGESIRDSVINNNTIINCSFAGIHDGMAGGMWTTENNNNYTNNKIINVTGEYGIFNYVTLGNIFRGNEIYGGTISKGIKSMQGGNLTIENNYIHDIVDIGIDIERSPNEYGYYANILIKNNTIGTIPCPFQEEEEPTPPSSVGILFYNTSYNNASYNTIYDTNTSIYIIGVGTQQQQQSHNIIEYNNLSDGVIGINVNYTDNEIVRYNTLYNFTDTCINFFNTTLSNVNNNDADQCGTYGIHFEDVGTTIIDNNNVTNSYYNLLWNSPQIIAENCTVTNNDMKYGDIVISAMDQLNPQNQTHNVSGNIFEHGAEFDVHLSNCKLCDFKSNYINNFSSFVHYEFVDGVDNCVGDVSVDDNIMINTPELQFQAQGIHISMSDNVLYNITTSGALYQSQSQCGNATIDVNGNLAYDIDSMVQTQHQTGDNGTIHFDNNYFYNVGWLYNGGGQLQFQTGNGTVYFQNNRMYNMYQYQMQINGTSREAYVYNNSFIGAYQMQEQFHASEYLDFAYNTIADVTDQHQIGLSTSANGVGYVRYNTFQNIITKNPDGQCNGGFYFAYIQNIYGNLFDGSDCNSFHGWGAQINASIYNNWFINNRIGLELGGGGETGYSNYTNNYFYNNDEWDYSSKQQDGGAYYTNVFTNNTFTNVTIDFTHLDNLDLHWIAPITTPTNKSGLRFFNVSETSGNPNWLHLTMHWQSSDEPYINESQLAFAKWNGTDWITNTSEFASDFGLNVSERYVYVNVTNFSSVYAPLGDTETPPTPVPPFNNTVATDGMNALALFNDWGLVMFSVLVGGFVVGSLATGTVSATWLGGGTFVLVVMYVAVAVAVRILGALGGGG